MGGWARYRDIFVGIFRSASIALSGKRKRREYPNLISKKNLQLYASLKEKKFRAMHQKFFVEGPHLLDEAVKAGQRPEIILCSSSYQSQFESQFGDKLRKHKIEIISDMEFKKLSDTQHPQGVGAVFPIPQPLPQTSLNNRLIYLDSIQDPGNLGTIIRTAQWFGFSQIILSGSCVDPYNPKVVRSSMGSIFSAEFIDDDIKNSALSKLRDNGYFLMAADIEGKNIFEVLQIPDQYILIFGNEGAGINSSISSLINAKLTIPRIGKGESLNVASAAAVILSQITSRIAPYANQR
jgi:TrmH family RNA methyltransferase